MPGASELVGVVGTFEMGGDDIMREVDEMVLEEDDDQFSPLITFMTRIQGTVQIKNTKFEWQENIIDKFAVTSASIPGTAAGAETANVVFQSPSMRVGDVIFHPGSGQRFKVTTWVSKTTTTSTIKLMRIPETQPGTAISGTPSFRVLGNYTLEKGYYPIGVGTKPDFYYNYTQLNTTVATISKTMKEVNTYHGSQFEEDNHYALKNMQGGQERSMLFAIPIEEEATFTNEEGNQSDGVFRMTQGVFDWIQSVGTYSGTIDKQTLNAFFGQKVFGPRNSGSRRKMSINGPNVMQGINDMANDQLRLMPGATELGLDIFTYAVWGQRRVAIMEEREFSYDVNASEYADTMLVIEPDLMSIMQLGSNFLTVEPLNAGPRDIEGIVYRSEFGLKIKGRGKHHRLTKVA